MVITASNRKQKQRAAKECVEALVRKLKQKVCDLELEIAHYKLKHCDELHLDRLACIDEALRYVDSPSDVPHAVQLKRNIASHTPSTLLAGKVVSELSPAELRTVQKGRQLQRQNDEYECSSKCFEWNIHAPPFVPSSTFEPVFSSAESDWQQSVFEAVPWYGGDEHPENQSSGSYYPTDLDFVSANFVVQTLTPLVQKLDTKMTGLADLVVSLPSSSKHVHVRGAPDNPPASDKPIECEKGMDRPQQPESELDKANLQITQLRAQAAASSAISARKDELLKQGRVLRTLHIPAGSNDRNFSLTDVFLSFAGKSDAINISEPYLVSGWQLQNFETLMDGLVSSSHVRAVKLTTHLRSQMNKSWFVELSERLQQKGIKLSIAFLDGVHLREIEFSNGVVVTCDRGLDIFKAPSADGTRACRNSTVVTYEVDAGSVARSFNLAGTVADNARGLLVQGLSQDVLKIEAMVEAASDRKQQDKDVKLLRLTLLERKVTGWLQELGLCFLADKFGTPTIGQFIEDAEVTGLDLTTKEGFQSQVKSWQHLGILSSVEEDYTEMYLKLTKNAEERKISERKAEYDQQWLDHFGTDFLDSEADNSDKDFDLVSVESIRVANDAESYTYHEFIKYYGLERGQLEWREAEGRDEAEFI